MPLAGWAGSLWGLGGSAAIAAPFKASSSGTEPAHQLTTPQQLLLGQQPLIENMHPGQALADGGQHLFFQEGDLLFSIGLLDPGAAQRQITPQDQHHLNGTQRGFEQQERIFLWPAELRSGSRETS